jgi:hypothetical protein
MSFDCQRLKQSQFDAPGVAVAKAREMPSGVMWTGVIWTAVGVVQLMVMFGLYTRIEVVGSAGPPHSTAQQYRFSVAPPPV